MTLESCFCFHTDIKGEREIYQMLWGSCQPDPHQSDTGTSNTCEPEVRVEPLPLLMTAIIYTISALILSFAYKLHLSQIVTPAVWLNRRVRNMAVSRR